MSIETSTSPDLPRIIVPKRHVDDRGWFSETFHEDRLRDLGITCRFVQDNQSSSKRAGTLRGSAFPASAGGPGQVGQRCCEGEFWMLRSMFDAARRRLASMFQTELSAESGHQLYIPVGFAHGFLTLEDDVVVMYKVSDYYAPALDSGICWNDPDIAFPWPLQGRRHHHLGQGSPTSAAEGILQSIRL